MGRVADEDVFCEDNQDGDEKGKEEDDEEKDAPNTVPFAATAQACTWRRRRHVNASIATRLPRSRLREAGDEKAMR